MKGWYVLGAWCLLNLALISPGLIAAWRNRKAPRDRSARGGHWDHR